MSHKLKVIWAVLLVVGVAAFAHFWSSFRTPNLAAQTNLETLSELNEALGIDTDQDGLSDIEESIWNTDFQNADTDGDGFMDGEEAASGHNPSVPGPDDHITGSPNVTERISTLVTGGLIEGSLKSTSENFSKAVDDIVDNIILSTRAGDGIVQVRTTDDSPENRAAYRKKMGVLILKIAPTLEMMPRTVSGNTFKTDDMVSEINDIVRPMLETDVPRPAETAHQEFISTLQHIQAEIKLLEGSEADSIRRYAVVSDLLLTLIERLPNSMEGVAHYFQ